MTAYSVHSQQINTLPVCTPGLIPLSLMAFILLDLVSHRSHANIAKTFLPFRDESETFHNIS